MELKQILAHCDHTLLKQTATFADIRTICEEGITYGCASVCIPACYVQRAADYATGRIPICTVIGFPNGYDTAAAKCFEAADAVKNGAEEIDMVINIGFLKAGEDAAVLDEIKRVKEACDGRILKVIVETCLLTEDEKCRMCDIVSASGADFIKTSTGFSTGGATADDIRLFAAHVAPHVRIKAAGGIATLDDAETFLNLGAERLGTSRIVKLAQKQSTEGLAY